MANYSKGAPSNGCAYVCNLPSGTTEQMLDVHFSTIGVIKKDKRTGRSKIWLYRDKVTNEPKGDATVTYEDPYAASAAVEWFNKKEFHGATIGVLMAESKKDDNSYSAVIPAEEPMLSGDFGGQGESVNAGNGGAGRGRWRGDVQQRLGNKMETGCARIQGSGGAGGGGRGRGRSSEPGGPGRGGVAAPTGIFGPNDWSCPMCGNINWAKRNKCNICNTNKPGTNEGGVRGGRAGGYKELDEEEIEETRRRRREAEEDDGEMYDEFGNLKKKYRVKMQQAEIGQVLPGTGRAGWEVEELGMSDRDRREKSRDRGKEREENKYREREDRNKRSSRSCERDRGRDINRSYDNDKNREYGRDHDRERDRYRY
ncbi:hypothetical protein AgCh_032688 [Apium graveolens]